MAFVCVPCVKFFSFRVYMQVKLLTFCFICLSVMLYRGLKFVAFDID